MDYRDHPAGSAYVFRQCVKEDLAMLDIWLRAPEVVRWWGNPEEQARLLEEDLDEPGMTMRIVSLHGRPFAYAQHYEVHTWPQPHFECLPRGSRAIDSFIGEADMVGKGHGSAFLRLLAEQLIDEGAPLVAIDPHLDNFRARRAYQKAGFRSEREVVTGEGPAMLMIYKGEP